nr:MMPL family transporter [Streptomyces sp. SS52]
MELTDPAREALTAATDEGGGDGYTVETGGDAVMAEQEMGGTAELIASASQAVVLLLTFGSLVAAGMPLLSAIIGVGIGISGIGALRQHPRTLRHHLHAGHDDRPRGRHRLRPVHRLALRAEIAEGRTPEEAAGARSEPRVRRRLRRITVIVGPGGPRGGQHPDPHQMGLAAAATVGIAVLIRAHHDPALLGFAGKKALSRKDGKAAAGQRAASAKPKLGTRWARFVLRRPVTVLLTAVLGLGVVAVPATSLDSACGRGQLGADTTQRKAYDMLSESFGAGFNGR